LRGLELARPGEEARRQEGEEAAGEGMLDAARDRESARCGRHSARRVDPEVGQDAATDAAPVERVRALVQQEAVPLLRGAAAADVARLLEERHRRPGLR